MLRLLPPRPNPPLPVSGAMGVVPGVRSPAMFVTGTDGEAGGFVGEVVVVGGVAVVVGVAVGVVGVVEGVGVVFVQFWHGGSDVVRRFRNVSVWPTGLWFVNEPVQITLAGAAELLVAYLGSEVSEAIATAQA